jgi:hypothetical protein
MRVSRKCLTWTAAALVGFAAAPCPAGDTPPASYGLDWQVFPFDADQFTVRVPPEWFQIPAFNMEGFINGAAAQSFLQDQHFPQNYKHGFQQGPIRQWFQPPYFLIDIHTRGRVTRRQLAEMTRVEQALPGGGPFREDGTRGVFSKTPVGSFIYEPGPHVIWLHFQRVGPAGERMRAVAALFLTQNGGIQLNFYCQEADFARYAELFERIARSTEVSDYLRYRTSFLESWPLLNSLDWSDPTMRYVEIGLVLVFVIGLACLFYKLVQRAKANESNPLNPFEDENEP